MSKYFKLEEGWSTLFLVWSMVFVAGLTVIQTELIGGLEIIPTIGTLAILVGLILAKSAFSDRTAHVFSVFYAAFILTYFIGGLLPGDLSWRERVFDVFNRQSLWLGKVFDGTTSRDGLIFVMHTSAIFWLLGYTASWYTFRRIHLWRVVLPTGLVLLSVVYYYFGPKPLVLYLAVYAILALVYISQTHLVARERAWRAASVRYESFIRLNFIWSSLLASVLALAIAWSVPALTANAAVSDAVSNINRPWREFQDNWTRLFSSLRSYGAGSSDPYDTSLNLGGPRTVGNTPIMDVFASQDLPYVYWQAIAFDTYEDGGWSVSESERVLHFPDDGPLDIPTTRSRQLITQTIINYLPNSATLYAAPEVVNSDRQMFVDRRVNEQGRELVSGVRSRFQLQQGDEYHVASMMSFADAESLRNASTNYPVWVSDQYLQVPDTLSPETIDLAGQLGVMSDNPFDLSILVRDFLRSEITYNDQIEAPPDGVDPVHYVLFDLKQGYCNYYASAMSMLLRLNGVPARVVAGYAQGQFLEEDGFYRVRASNAHTWVEAYFPGYGWIQFEPTASIPTVDRPETAGGGGDNFGNESSPFGNLGPDLSENNGLQDDAPFGGDIDLSDENLASLNAQRDRDAVLLRAIVGGLILLVAGGAVVIATLVNRQIEGDVVRSYGRLGNWADRLGVAFRHTQTPYERATILSTAVPEGRIPIRNLTRQFVLRTFSQSRQEESGFDPKLEWQQLRPALWKSAIRRRFEKLRARERKPESANIRDILRKVE